MGIIRGEFTRVEFDRLEFSGWAFSGGGLGGDHDTRFALFIKALSILLFVF